MRTAILLHLMVFLSFGLFSQETIQRASEVKTESGVSLEIDETLFVGNVIPTDLPERSEYKSDEIYRKVIQGYINTHSELIIAEEAHKLGFTTPELIEYKSEDQRRQVIKEQRRRKEPISQEERDLKKKKESELR